MENHPSPKILPPEKRPVLRFDRWILILLIASAIFILTDKVLEKYNGFGSRHQDDNKAFSEYVHKLFGIARSTSEELILAEKFETDTLPRVLQEGLVKQFKRNEEMTLVLVDGTRWVQQDHAMKANLIFEIVITNKVRGYASALQVRDYQSGKIYANIRPPATVEMYD